MSALNVRERQSERPGEGTLPAVPDSAPERPRHGGATASNTYLFVPIALFFALLNVTVLRDPQLMSNSGLGSAIIVAVPLILATYSVMAIAIAGRVSVDLSVGPLIGFLNVTLVQLFGLGIIHSPGAFFLYAICAGIAYQLVVGLIIVFVRVQPIIVSLSGYLALSGIDLVIMKRPGGTVPAWMSSWGLGTSIVSPVTLIVVLATLAWIVFTRTAFYAHLRLMGSDERAAYVSGVHINVVRLGAHAIGGIYAGLAAITYTSLISSGDPTQGTTYTLIAVTALVLGGANLAGGRGGVIGSLLGALNIYLITALLATFDFGAVQGFVTDLSYGTILVISLVLTLALPWVRRVVGSLSPLLFFVILSLATAGVVIHATYPYAKATVAGEPVVATHSAGTPAPSGTTRSAAHAQELARHFIFENSASPEVRRRAGPAGHPYALAGPIGFAVAILLAVVFIIRVIVAQAEAGTRSLAPLVYIIIAALVLLGFFVIANPHQAASLLGVAPIHPGGSPK